MPAAVLDPELVSRGRGALLGLAAGNQLGVPTERLGTPEAIRKAFPNGVWDLAPPPKNSLYDDDAAMALLLGESLVECKGFDATDVTRRWVKWMKMDGRGIGATTRRALTLVERGKEPFEAGRLVYQENPRSSAGNGSVMRCVPVALRYHDDFDRLIRVSTQQAAITHADERCTWAAVAGETGYVVHCVEIAFWFVLHDRTLEDALVYLAQAGGDTDTNAAVAGALLGARYGESALPPRWMDQLVGAQGIGTLAERLLVDGGR